MVFSLWKWRLQGDTYLPVRETLPQLKRPSRASASLLLTFKQALKYFCCLSSKYMVLQLPFKQALRHYYCLWNKNKVQLIDSEMRNVIPKQQLMFSNRTTTTRNRITTAESSTSKSEIRCRKPSKLWFLWTMIFFWCCQNLSWLGMKRSGVGSSLQSAEYKH